MGLRLFHFRVDSSVGSLLMIAHPKNAIAVSEKSFSSSSLFSCRGRGLLLASVLPSAISAVHERSLCTFHWLHIETILAHRSSIAISFSRPWVVLPVKFPILICDTTLPG